MDQVSKKHGGVKDRKTEVIKYERKIHYDACACASGDYVIGVGVHITLYVGLARDVPPTNTNFRLTFLLTQLQEALYEYLSV